jgi:acyl-CoA synthetase (AMP-forming)/AMP-acid ligase II
MTEASHQITSNPLPPAVRKPGAVGLPGRTDVAIVDPQGAPLPVGVEGEVAIRGLAVTAGYENDPAANARSRAGEWFRTGDLGRRDDDGYLTLTGRLKEMINRGGEKIAPREIDDALAMHPAVQQAVAFAVPDPMLGEDVAAAIVLRPGMTATEHDLRRHLARTLAAYKVPRRIVFVPQIPTGPSGKLQRIGLAQRLGLAADPATSPRPR